MKKKIAKKIVKYSFSITKTLLGGIGGTAVKALVAWRAGQANKVIDKALHHSHDDHDHGKYSDKSDKVAREALKIAKITAKAEAARDKKLLKAQKEQQKQALLLARERTQAIKAGRIFNPGAIGRYIMVTKILSPFLIPIVYRTSTQVQNFLNKRRAEAGGIPLLDLGHYSGVGGKLAARIEAARQSLRRIQKTNTANLEVKTFVSANIKKLEDLANAVNTAERLPRGRRINAQTKIDEHLTLIENDILIQLGV